MGSPSRGAWPPSAMGRGRGPLETSYPRQADDAGYSGRVRSGAKRNGAPRSGVPNLHRRNLRDMGGGPSPWKWPWRGLWGDIAGNGPKLKNRPFPFLPHTVPKNNIPRLVWRKSKPKWSRFPHLWRRSPTQNRTCTICRNTCATYRDTCSKKEDTCARNTETCSKNTETCTKTAAPAPFVVTPAPKCRGPAPTRAYILNYTILPVASK